MSNLFSFFPPISKSAAGKSTADKVGAGLSKRK